MCIISLLCSGETWGDVNLIVDWAAVACSSGVGETERENLNRSAHVWGSLSAQDKIWGAPLPCQSLSLTVEVASPQTKQRAGSSLSELNWELIPAPASQPPTGVCCILKIGKKTQGSIWTDHFMLIAPPAKNYPTGLTPLVKKLLLCADLFRYYIRLFGNLSFIQGLGKCLNSFLCIMLQHVPLQYSSVFVHMFLQIGRPLSWIVTLHTIKRLLASMCEHVSLQISISKGGEATFAAPIWFWLPSMLEHM